MAFRAPMSIQQIADRLGIAPGVSHVQARNNENKRKWRGVRLQMRGDGLTFYVINSWEARHDLKDFGFRWNADSKAFETTSEHIAAKIVDLAVGAAKEKLVPHSRMNKAMDTFARAATRLEAGDEQRVRTSLTPAIARAIRQAVAILAGCDDDKATVRNKSGFSKADTELGHTLHLSGVKTYREAALALKLTWRYRGQLPQAIIQIAFPVHVQDAVSVLTDEQADALVTYFDTDADAAMQQLQTAGAYVHGEQTVADGQGMTRTRIAAVERGRSIYYIEQDGGARHWLEIA